LAKLWRTKHIGKTFDWSKISQQQFVVISCAQFSSFEKNTTTSNIRYKKLCIIEGLTNSKGNLIVALVGSPKLQTNEKNLPEFQRKIPPKHHLKC